MRQIQHGRLGTLHLSQHSLLRGPRPAGAAGIAAARPRSRRPPPLARPTGVRQHGPVTSVTARPRRPPGPSWCPYAMQSGDVEVFSGTSQTGCATGPRPPGSPRPSADPAPFACCHPPVGQFRASRGRSMFIASRGAGDLQGPRSQQRRRVRVRRPDQPNTVTLIAQAPSRCRDRQAARRPFYEFGNDVCTRSTSTTTRTPGGHLLRVPFHHRGAEPGHLHVQRRSDRGDQQRQPPTAASSMTSLSCPSRGVEDHRHRPGLPAVQHRAAVHAELRRAGRRGRARPGGEIAVFAGSAPKASTSTSARSRPGRPAAVSETCTPSGTCRRRRRTPPTTSTCARSRSRCRFPR